MKISNRYLAAGVSLSLALFLPAISRADDKADAYQFGKDGIEAAKKKEWAKAIDLFQKAVKADPKEANNHNNLGLAYKGAGKMDEAIKAFSDAIEAEPNNSTGYVNRGVLYTSQQKNKQAIEDLDKAIKLNPGSIAGYRFRAFAYLQMKDYKKAIEDYNVVLKEKDDAAILDRRAFALWNLKEYDKAIADYNTIIKDKPKDKEGYRDRSYVYELQGDLVKGIADCDKVLSIDPKNEDAKNRKERLEYKQKAAVATPTPTPRPRRTLPPEPSPTPKHKPSS
jgi:tetratricopeptide (TPR) repeat protein